MKKNELIELKTKTIEELVRDVAALKKEIVELSHDIKIGKSTASAALRTKKKNVARHLTIIGQMRLNPQTPKIVEKKEEKKSDVKKTKKVKTAKGEK